MKEHLEYITVYNLKKWKSEIAFSIFASSTGTYGRCVLGINGLGHWEVRHNDKIHTCTFANEAIEKYKSIIQ